MAKSKTAKAKPRAAKTVAHENGKATEQQLELPIGPPPSDKVIALDKTIETIEQTCMELRLSIPWLPLSKKVDKDSAKKMAAVVGASADGVSQSKRLFSAKNEAMKRMNAARSRLHELRNAWTFAKAALTTSKTDRPEKDAGIRLIRIEDIDHFETLMTDAAAELRSAVEALQEAMASIKVADKARFGELYNANDYPDDVTKLVKVIKSYHSISYVPNFEILAPATFAKELAKNRRVLADTVELQASAFAEVFLSQIATLCRQVGNRTRLDVPRSHPMAYLRDAEVWELNDHDTHPDELKADEVRVQLQFKKPGAEKPTKDWFRFTTAEYAALEPYKTDQTGTFHSTSITKLLAAFESFDRLGEYAGDLNKKTIDDAIGKVRAEIESRFKGNPAAIGDLHTSKIFRKEIEKAIEPAVDELRAAVVTIEKRRRVVDKSL